MKALLFKALRQLYIKQENYSSVGKIGWETKELQFFVYTKTFYYEKLVMLNSSPCHEDNVDKVPCLNAQHITSSDHSRVWTSNLTVTGQTLMTTEPCAIMTRNVVIVTLDIFSDSRCHFSWKSEEQSWTTWLDTTDIIFQRWAIPALSHFLFVSVVWNSGSAGYFRFAITQWRQQEFATRYHVGQNIRYGIKVSKSESEI